MRWLTVFFSLSALLFGIVTYVVVVIGPDEYQTTWRLKKQWVSQTWPDIDYVVIGNSKTMALNVDNAIPNMLNLSLSSIPYEYVYYALKEFSTHNRHVKQYYIELSPISSSYESFLPYYADAKMVKEMATIEPQMKIDFEKLNFISRRFYPLEQFKWKYSFMRAGITNAYYRDFTERTNGAYIFGYGHKKIEDRNDHIYTHEYTKRYGVQKPINQYYFEKIIQLIDERKLNVKFFYSPNRKTEMEYWASPSLRIEGFKNVASFLQTLLEHNKIPQLYLPDEYFVEGVHLQYQYAHIYTEFFRTCIMNDDCEAYEDNIIWLQDFLEQPVEEDSHAL